eukprot:gene8786-6173_t
MWYALFSSLSPYLPLLVLLVLSVCVRRVRVWQSLLFAPPLAIWWFLLLLQFFFFCSPSVSNRATMGFSAKKAYLVLYNGSMFIGWGCILAKMAIHMVKGGKPAEALTTVYPAVQGMLVIFQTGAVAEILHSLFKIVRSPLPTTFAQVLSRLIVLYGALEIGPTASRQSPFLVQMLTAWCLSELIRYSFYTFNLTTGKPPKFLVWLRYTAFTVLYPVGISGEIAMLYLALPYIKESGRWTIELPNTMNISFNWPYVIWFILLGLYPPASKFLYGHMLAQRRKLVTHPRDGHQSEGCGTETCGDERSTNYCMPYGTAWDGGRGGFLSFLLPFSSSSSFLVCIVLFLIFGKQENTLESKTPSTSREEYRLDTAIENNKQTPRVVSLLYTNMITFYATPALSSPSSQKEEPVSIFFFSSVRLWVDIYINNNNKMNMKVQVRINDYYYFSFPRCCCCLFLFCCVLSYLTTLVETRAPFSLFLCEEVVVASRGHAPPLPYAAVLITSETHAGRLNTLPKQYLRSYADCKLLLGAGEEEECQMLHRTLMWQRYGTAAALLGLPHSPCSTPLHGAEAALRVQQRSFLSWFGGKGSKRLRRSKMVADAYKNEVSGGLGSGADGGTLQEQMDQSAAGRTRDDLRRQPPGSSLPPDAMKDLMELGEVTTSRLGRQMPLAYDLEVRRRAQRASAEKAAVDDRYRASFDSLNMPRDPANANRAKESWEMESTPEHKALVLLLYRNILKGLVTFKSIRRRSLIAYARLTFRRRAAATEKLLVDECIEEARRALYVIGKHHAFTETRQYEYDTMTMPKDTGQDVKTYMEEVYDPEVSRQQFQHFSDVQPGKEHLHNQKLSPTNDDHGGRQGIAATAAPRYGGMPSTLAGGSQSRPERVGISCTSRNARVVDVYVRIKKQNITDRFMPSDGNDQAITMTDSLSLSPAKRQEKKKKDKNKKKRTKTATTIIASTWLVGWKAKDNAHKSITCYTLTLTDLCYTHTCIRVTKSIGVVFLIICFPRHTCPFVCLSVSTFAPFFLALYIYIYIYINGIYLVVLPTKVVRHGTCVASSFIDISSSIYAIKQSNKQKAN